MSGGSEDKYAGSTVSLHDIYYTIKEKKILQGISCKFTPGLNAILGPTGGGKTTLLDIAAGRKSSKGLEGLVLVDGQKQPKNYRAISGYVVQDDMVMGLMTVRENLMFSANLRIRGQVPLEQRKRIVSNVIDELGLTHCADSLMGNQYIRGVSGGERKRTNIGMELVHNPKVLFLDEPTTGLDASTANALFVHLKNLAEQGHTIIFSIHQPRYSIFKNFDQLTLLALGRIVFHGPTEQALGYFESIGHNCEKHNNPPDFFLDVINDDSSAVKSQKQEGEISAPIRIKSGKVSDVPKDDAETTTAETLANQFRKSNVYNKEKKALDLIWNQFQCNEDLPPVTARLAASFCSQFRWISKRTLTNIFRNPETYVMQIIVVVVFALLVGLIYLRLDKTIEYGIPNRAGAFFFIVMNQIFQNLSAVDIFIKERALFIHENAGGYYGCLAYFVSKIFCDLVPMRMQPVLIFSAISYFMIGLDPTVGKFFFYALVLFLTTVAACSVCFFISACVSIFAIANLAVALIFVFMMVYSGMLVKLSTVGWWFKWMKYISIFRYSLNALAINEMQDMEFCVDVNKTEICDKNAGNQYLEEQEITFGTTWDKWVNIVALISISAGLLVLTYVVLRLLKKTT